VSSLPFFVHWAAVVQARVAVDAIQGGQSRFSPRWVPPCIHTDPPIASIGWNEDEAGKAGLELIAHSQTFRLLTDDERKLLGFIRWKKFLNLRRPMESYAAEA